MENTWYDLIVASILVSKLEEAIRNIGDFGTNEPILSYVDYLLSIPKAIPRKIIRAKEFNCPDKVKGGLQILERAILNGDSLLPWLSSKYTKRSGNEKDCLRHLFNVLHFHLGNDFNYSKKKERKIKRTGALLYAYVTSHAVYELGIDLHGKWGDIRWQDIIMTNWPELIPRGTVLENIVDITAPVPTAEELYELTKLGINTILNIGGKFVFPLGGGVTSSGRSEKAARLNIGIQRLLVRIEETLIQCGLTEEKLNNIPVIVDNDKFIIDRELIFSFLPWERPSPI